LDKTQEPDRVTIPLAKPVFDKEMKKAAIEAFLSERFVLGESVFKFEEEFAKYCCTDYAVSTSSGTDALQIALVAMGITHGENVLTVPASFVATANAILHAGATPIFVDIDSETYTIDPRRIAQARNASTKAVIPVHLYGYPADMDSINEISGKHKIRVIEDACQAHGAIYRGRKVGSLGDIACFSFYPSKNMTVAGDGGVLVTNDEEVASKAAKLRDCGRKSKYIHDLVGYTSRLNTVNAAIGRVQLKHLDEWNERRRDIAEIYNRSLSDIDGLVLPPKGDHEIRPVYHLYVVRTKYRDRLKMWLESRGIQSEAHYVLPIHLQPVYRKMYEFSEGTYPKSEELCKTCLSIPMYPGLAKGEINFVCEKVHGFFRS
jgi:perosamine synthetase